MYRTHRQHSLLSSGGVPSFIGGLVVFVSAAFNAQAETWFDPAFFKDDPSMVADLSRFEKGQKITTGGLSCRYCSESDNCRYAQRQFC